MIKKRNFFLLFYTLLFVSVTIAQDTSRDEWKKKHVEGLEAFDLKNYEEAKLNLEEAYKIGNDIFTEENEELEATSFLLGKTYYALKQYDKAIEPLEKSLSILEKLKGNKHLDSEATLRYLGLTYYSLRDYEKALPLLLNALNILKENDQDLDSTYESVLNRVGRIYRSTGEFDKAIEVNNERLEIVQKTKGKNHLEYGKVLLDLAIVYKNSGQFDIAIKKVENAMNIIEVAVGSEHKSYGACITTLSQIYYALGNYDKAIKMQSELLKLYENDEEAKKTEEYAGALYTMSMLYHKIDEFEKEVESLREVIDILGEEHRAFVTFNNALSLAYERMGNYEKALFHIQKALSKTKKSNKSYGIRLQNLAYIYVGLGEYDKAIETYNLALRETEGKKGKNHADYGQVLNNMGKLYFQINDIEKAQEYFGAALNNFLINFDENHANFGYLSNDYAKTLLLTGNEDEAITRIKKTINLAEKNSRTGIEAYFKAKYNLANAYNSIGNYKEALPIFIDAAENTKLILGDDHPDYGGMLKSLSECYVGLNDINSAIPIIKSTNQILIKQLDDIFKFRSENEKQLFLKKINRNFDDIQSVSFKNTVATEQLTETNLNNQLMLKGLLLNNSKDVLSGLTTLDNPEINNKIIEYRFQKGILTKQLSQSIDERGIDVDSLKEVINNKEAELVKLYSSNFDANIDLKKNWKQSQSALRNNDVAIEFSHFNLTSKGKKTDSIMYVAYVYDATSENPKMIPLFEERELKLILVNNKTKNELYQSPELYNLIWKPLDRYITKNANVYFAPSGLLNQLSFSAIPILKDILINKYNLEQLSSTDVLVNKQNEPDISSTLFVGGINYEYSVDSAEEEIIADSEAYNYLESASFSNSRGTMRGESWTELPGALAEIETLSSKFEVQGKSVITLSKNDATEANFKKLSGNSPNILHIATHGFFFENLNREVQFETDLSMEDQYRLAEDPLLRSGLILAGANYAWKNNSKPINEEEDGILTAMEISNLDLSNTNMVVLSACETGLGDIDGSEGVYGLQRAFKMAGVDIIVMSLWKVPDAETAEFMNAFYENWLGGDNVKLAFNNAQRAMYKKYKNEPLKWAAFVLFE